MEGISLITTTGGRPEAFGLCRRWMERQTWKGPVEWIVVDDCERPTEVPDTLLGGVVTALRPAPIWSPGQNTLARNLLLAIPHVTFGRVLFCEDDDWYAPYYLAVMSARLDRADIVGEIPARYYHLPSRRGMVLSNVFHASLSQTGIKSWLLASLQTICEKSPDFIDVRLWAEVSADSDTSAPLWEGKHSIGMKGLPGRPGIGIGHYPERAPGQWVPDSDLSILREWIGNDVEAYMEFLA